MQLQFVVLITLMFVPPTFKEAQLKFERVRTAYSEKETTVKDYFTARRLPYKGFKLFLRAFKEEATLEVWVARPNDEKFVLLHTYDVCANSGMPGPKRMEGDYQVPEGVYHINHFNPASNYYLSLGINYPNASDKILSDQRRPGSAIYVHGNCVTIGCLPITDAYIKELYVMAVEARNGGQTEIPIHVFPARLDNNNLSKLSETFPGHKNFWKNLKVVYDDFESGHTLNPVKVLPDGRYAF